MSGLDQPVEYLVTVVRNLLAKRKPGDIGKYDETLELGEYDLRDLTEALRKIDEEAKTLTQKRRCSACARTREFKVGDLIWQTACEHCGNRTWYDLAGITARDQLALAALPAVLAVAAEMESDTSDAFIANRAYEIADAMLLERSRR